MRSGRLAALAILERGQISKQPGDTTVNCMQCFPTAQGLAIEARILGSQTPTRLLPIVLVHGLGVSGRYMLPLAGILAERHRVLVPDLPGFGRSGRPSHPLSIPELADALAAWLSSVNVDRAAFLGNSLGCQVIVELAARYSQRVAVAILISPTVDRWARTMPRQLWHAFRDVWLEPWSLWPIVASDYWNTGIGRLYRTFRYALQDPVEQKLARMGTPTLIVRGGRDTIVPQKWAEEVVTLLPHGRLVVVPGVAHAVNYSAPTAVASIASEFIAAYS